jgi:hypothetical protein
MLRVLKHVVQPLQECLNDVLKGREGTISVSRWGLLLQAPLKPNVQEVQLPEQHERRTA